VQAIMVGKGPMPSLGGKPNESLAEALRSAYPELDAIREAALGPVFVVGGAVRDLLLGRGRADLDVVVEGEAAALAARLGAEPVSHERFATAKVVLDGHEVDIAGARTETYAHPGALPEVAPAASIEADLARRDFTVNAMAIPLGEPRLIDPHRGQVDLEAGLLRVLHSESFVDDPTRAIRAARYAARFGFRLEGGTEELLRAADLDSVSADRRRAELLRLAAETSASRGFALLAEWGLLAPRESDGDLVARVTDLAAAPPWRELLAPPDRARAVLAAALGPAGGERALVAETPERPSQAVALADGHDPVDLVLARTLGAEWLDDYLAKWRAVELEIDGADLLAAGVPQGPALGRGLAAALRAKLDGEISGREQELATALAAARSE
jgi:tRNA nucleotidyltransferase (CCA-adding enzyme)